MGPMAPAGYGNRVEGLHAVAAAFEAGRVRKLYVDRRRKSRSEIVALLDSTSAEVQIVDDVRSLAETDSPQGVVADCDAIQPVSLDSLSVEGAAVLVLDHVEDPHNVGAVARSAAAAGITGMVVSSKRAAPLSATAFKASVGALERLPVAVVGSIPEALSRLKKGGLWVVGLAADGDQPLFGLDLLTESVAVVIGAEGDGLAELTKKRCDVLASIPMVGETESLNASVSGALASFEIVRVRS